MRQMPEEERTQYLIRHDDGVIKSPLPFVTLSFVPSTIQTFRHFQFRDSTRFSSQFAQWFDDAYHLTSAFLDVTPTDEQTFEILKGYRDGDVTFFHSLTEERKEELELMNEYAERYDMARTTQRITLLHWVTNNDDLDHWLRVETADTLVCREWLDTHAHPGWYYPLAEASENDERRRKVLLRIHIPEGTKALRVPIFEVSKTVAGDSESGTWLHNEQTLGLEEVRLPPGSYTVENLYPYLKYDGENVFVVELLYTQNA